MVRAFRSIKTIIGDRERESDKGGNAMDEEGQKEGEEGEKESFGGPRNQEDTAYVFDAQPYCPPIGPLSQGSVSANVSAKHGRTGGGTGGCRVAVALSDGSIRIVRSHVSLLYLFYWTALL